MKPMVELVVVPQLDSTAAGRWYQEEKEDFAMDLS